MAKTETVRARIDPKLKADAEAIFEKLGVSASDVIRVLYKRVTMEKGLPFELRIPNRETRRVMREADAGRGLTRYKSTQEMFEKLGLLDDEDE